MDFNCVSFINWLNSQHEGNNWKVDDIYRIYTIDEWNALDPDEQDNYGNSMKAIFVTVSSDEQVQDFVVLLGEGYYENALD